MKMSSMLILFSGLLATFDTVVADVPVNQPVQIISQKSGLCLAADGDTGGNVYQAHCNDSNQQKWMLTTHNNRFVVTNLSKGKVLDVIGGFVNNGDNIQLWDWLENPQQHWQINLESNGYYRFTADHSGKVLDVYGGHEYSGANVHQWEWLANPQQHWQIKTLNDELALEAELAHYTPALNVKESGTALNRHYLEMQAEGSIRFSAALDKQQTVSLQLRYRAPLGDKRQKLRINGNDLGDIQFPHTNEWQTIEKNVVLEKGINTIELSAFWGWMDVDALIIKQAESEFAPGDERFKIQGQLVHDASGNAFISRTINGTGQLTKIDSLSGDTLWTYIARDNIKLSVAFDNDNDIYVTEQFNDYIIALDSRTGKEKWRMPHEHRWSDNSGLSLKQQSGDVLYFLSTHSAVAIEKSSGKRLWEYDIERIFSFQSKVHQDYVIISTNFSKQFHILNRRTGQLIRIIDNSDGFQLLSDDDAIYLQKDGVARKVHWETGDQLWQNAQTARLTQTRQGLAFSSDSKLGEIDSETGTEIWSIPSNGKAMDFRVLSNDHIYAVQRDAGEIIALDHNRKEYWRDSSGNFNLHNLQETGENALFHIDGSTIIRMDLTRGGVSWITSLNTEGFLRITASDKGTLYVNASVTRPHEVPTGSFYALDINRGIIRFAKRDYHARVRVAGHALVAELIETDGNSAVVGLQK